MKTEAEQLHEFLNLTIQVYNNPSLFNLINLSTNGSGVYRLHLLEYETNEQIEVSDSEVETVEELSRHVSYVVDKHNKKVMEETRISNSIRKKLTPEEVKYIKEKW